MPGPRQRGQLGGLLLPAASPRSTRAAPALLFERFISDERNEPPDIDIDFEHQRREEVIQYIYGKYGRAPRRAHRGGHQLPTALGAARRRPGARHRPAADRAPCRRTTHWFDGRGIAPERLRENGFDPESPRGRGSWIELTGAAARLPAPPDPASGRLRDRARTGCRELVPVENAAMDDRTVIQWDKDDLDALGLLKVDILALGMLSALRRALELHRRASSAARRSQMQDDPRRSDTADLRHDLQRPTRSACSRSRAARR